MTVVVLRLKRPVDTGATAAERPSRVGVAASSS
jgi:hypothetical protein